MSWTITNITKSNDSRNLFISKHLASILSLEQAKLSHQLKATAH